MVQADSMPRTNVILFAEADGSCPLLEWPGDARHIGTRARDKCIVRIERLAEHGHSLRRPEADHLGDGIHELRIRAGHVNLRMLYFFHERGAVLTHGFDKKAQVPDREIEWAIRRRALFQREPDRHTLRE